MMKAVTGITVLLLASVFGTGCSSTGPARDDQSAADFLHDEAFPRSGDYVIESPGEIYALDAEVRAYLDSRIRSVTDMEKRGQVLLDEVFAQAALNLSYDSGANTMASATFRGRAANCLSLSILAYAMARYTGFEASFHEVAIPEYWERRSNYSVLNRHVNVRFKPPTEYAAFMMIQPEMEVDFQRLGGKRRPPSWPIDQSRVTAMFYNNKAVDALFAGQHDLAYAYLKAALTQDSTLAPALTNIGLLYARNGHMAWAEDSLRQAFAIDGDSTATAENLAALLNITGRPEEAGKIMSTIKARRENNPYYVHMQGKQAYDAGDWQKAIRYFSRAVALKTDVDQFHFDLARAYFMIGDIKRAKDYMQRAERRAVNGELKEKYRGKLSALSNM